MIAEGSNAVFLKVEHSSELPRGLIETQISELHPQAPNLLYLGWGKEFRF